MHRTIPALLLSSVMLFACDSDDSSELESVVESSELEPDALERPREARRHERGDRHERKLARLCESLGCTDTQREQLTPIMERLRHRPPHERGESSPAKDTLAGAFAGDALSTADLVTYREARPTPEGRDDRAAAIVELHGALDAEQRGILAEKIERRGLPWLGRAGKHRRHGSGGHAAKSIEHLCRRLKCSDDQRQQLVELAEQRPVPPEVSEAERKALATAFAGETLSLAAIEAYRDAAQQARARVEQVSDVFVVAMHAVLSPEQRASMAERIRRRGLRALELGGREHGRRGKRHGKRRRPGSSGEAPQAFG